MFPPNELADTHHIVRGLKGTGNNIYQIEFPDKTQMLAELPARFIISLMLIAALIPVMVMRWRGYISPLGWLTKVRWGREMSVVTAMVVLILGLFLIVQWPYVFVTVAKETDLSKYGVATYSEYVQKGFWEMIKVVFMVFGVSWIGLLINKYQSGAERKLLLWVQGLLAGEFVIFILSIFRRVWLYQSYHGLTLARLYGLALLVLIVGMMVTMALRYVYQNVKWVKVEATWVLAVVFGSILLNMESLVVKVPPTVNDRVDYVYLSRLSSDGYDGWRQSYDWAKQVLEKNSVSTNQVARDDRRDIFYAGLITRELANNYHKLITQYGSDEEVREYFREVISARLETATGQSMDGMISDELAKIRQRQVDLDKDDWLEKVDITPIPKIAPTWDYSFPNYKAHQTDPYFYIQGSQEEERLVGMDYLLSFEPRDKQLYERVKRDIGYKSLLEMQMLDFSLQKSIAAQTETERDFDIDISLESPFLR